MNPKIYLLLTLLLTLTTNFSLEGQWKYQNNAEPNSPEEVTLQIEDFIFRGQDILQKLIFKGCKEMLIQSQFSENQVFVNPSSYMSQPIDGKSCNNLDKNPLDNIYSTLLRVFYLSNQRQLTSFQ